MEFKERLPVPDKVENQRVGLGEKEIIGKKRNQKDLPQIDKKSGKYIDKDGESWVILKPFAKELGISSGKIRSLIDDIHCIEGRDTVGREGVLYNEQELKEKLRAFITLPSVDKENGRYIDQKGESWVAVPTLAESVGISTEKVRRSARDNVPHIFGRDRVGKVISLYNERELKEKLKNFSTLPSTDRETGEYVDESGGIWAPIKTLAAKLGISELKVKSSITDIQRIPGKAAFGKETILYNKEELKEKLKDFLALPSVDKSTGRYIDQTGNTWITIRTFGSEFGISREKLNHIKASIDRISGRDKGGREVVLYNVQELKEKFKDFVELPQADESTGEYIDGQGIAWAPIWTLGREFKLDPSTIESAIETHNIKRISAKDRIGRKTTFYNKKELERKLKDFMGLPRIDKATGEYIDYEGRIWAPLSVLAGEMNSGGYEKIKSFINKENIDHILGRDRSGREVVLYNKQELKEKLRGLVVQRESVKNLEQEFSNFIEEVAHNKTQEAQKFRNLLRLVGSARAKDLLYIYHPEYKGISPDYVNGVISSYLGNFLLVRGGGPLPDLKIGLEYLSDRNLKDGFYEVLKDQCFEFYKQKRKEGIQSDREIFEDYTNNLKRQTQDWNSEDVNEVIERLNNYYLSLFEDFQKPSRTVDFLQEGRDFPDVFQLINIKEIADKKKILIADEMGLGKSASVILAKEHLDLKRALIVAPSNVLPVWQGYLSDSREQNGYFKEGQAPKALVIEDQQSLQGIDLPSYDYILISQEKLKPQYTEALEGLDYDMLIIDEVHKLKNIQKGRRAANVIRLADRIQGDNRYLALLSGTPVPNKILDLAMILKLLYPERFEHINNDKLVASIINGEMLDLRNILMPRIQMKNLTENLEMPRLTEDIIDNIELSQPEKIVYEALLEEDELTATEKIALLRQFLLNPELLDTTPGIESSKVKVVGENLRKEFETRNKVVMYANDYIEDVIRGENSIIPKLGLSADVKVIAIHGEISQEERIRIQNEFKTSDKKILLLVSGKTADVGVDFSAADSVYFYNEPWTRYDYRQQLGRVYRPGLKTDLESKIFVVGQSIEEGINYYIRVKERAIEKLLRGIPTSELEKRLLRRAEKQINPNLEVDPKLAEYFLSSWDTLVRNFYPRIKEQGEGKFMQFLEQYGREYADCYLTVEGRGYQANASRVAATLIEGFVGEKKQKVERLKIIDIASGPEMLKKHIGDQYGDKVFSIDINEHHFREEGGKKAVASFLKLPFQDSSFDYANLSLAWHYTNFEIRKNKFERIEVLREVNRVLKDGGRIVLNLIYSDFLKNEDEFKSAIDSLGFKMVDEYTGEVREGDNYRSTVITLEKKRDSDSDFESIINKIGKDNLRGFRFDHRKVSLKDSRRIIQGFEVNGKRFNIDFNKKDTEAFKEEQEVLSIGERLKKQYRKIDSIPREEVINNNFFRVLLRDRKSGKPTKYLLIRKMTTAGGAVVIRD